MLERAVILEYWQDPQGRYFAASRDHPITASGDSLTQLKAEIAGRIRAVFMPGPVPPVYDLVRRDPRP
jgi:hypothetical protein